MTTQTQTRAERRLAKRLKNFDNPWHNPKLFWGIGILLGIVLVGILGRFLWDMELVFTGSGMLRLPPLGFENLLGQEGSLAHPLGTDGSGRDVLALLIVGAPNSLFVGVLASVIGMSIGIFLGFTAGFMGGTDRRCDPCGL
jgi:peptide/nickel transport system permease protein